MAKSKKSISTGFNEKLLDQLTKELKEKNFSTQEEIQKYINENYLGQEVEIKEDNSSRGQAQELVYKAMDSGDPRKKISLAEKALALDENNADAYTILAYHKAESLEEKRDYYLKAIEAGRAVLGDDFENFKGHFWGIHETRPFMRAMSGYSFVLWALGEKNKSIEVMKEMLDLNPNDNQGVRHSLITKLLLMNRYLDAERLLDEYRNDESAEWYYSRAYIYFNKRSKRFAADAALKDAMEYNPYVPFYLLSVFDLPEEMPEYVSLGGRNEAVSYTMEAIGLWRNNQKATEWLVGLVGKMETRLKILIDKEDKRQIELEASLHNLQ
jgi:hypothetical protein